MDEARSTADLVPGVVLHVGDEYSSSSAQSTTNKAATIKGGDVEVAAGRDVKMEGTQVAGQKSVAVSAGRNVKLLEAKDSKSSDSLGIAGSATLSKTVKPDGVGKKQAGSLNLKSASEDQQTGKATKIQSGDKVTITSGKGGSITSQQADISAKGDIRKQGPVIEKSLTRVDRGSRVNVDVDVVHKTKSEAKTTAKPAPKAKTKTLSSRKKASAPGIKKR